MTEATLQRWIGNLLRAGVSVAAIVVGGGGVFHLANHAHDRVDFHVLRFREEIMQTVPGILDSAVHLRSEGVVQFGLLLLVATPVLRVVFAAVGFFLERDYLYAVVSLVVLGILLFSITHAL